MAKTKSSFFCQNCGAESSKWIGKCPSCGEWNTYVEEIIKKENTGGWKPPLSKEHRKPIQIQHVTAENLNRISSCDSELDRVLGGGIVLGSLVLIGGEPGIGKSTLLLQVAVRIGKKVLYVSGEESPQQIKMRADRIGILEDGCYLLSETSMETIFTEVEQLKPELIILDSIQTIHSSQIEATPGSISQVRECAGQFMRYAKLSNIPVFLIGHINKEGNIAGPKVLEHMVDTVLQFEGDRNIDYKILRTTKNRFGSTDELGIYRMRESGLEIVENPSEMLISDHPVVNGGIAIGTSMEGNRPLLIEIQALVSPATYGTPQRSSTGFDIKRLHMLLAVLEKRLGIRLSNQDVFLNITGGIKVTDPSIDLAVCAAVYSSFQDHPLPDKSCFIGEVGLGGEIRSVSRLVSRVSEAEKLGYENIFLNAKKVEGSKARLRSVKSLKEFFSGLFV